MNLSFEDDKKYLKAKKISIQVFIFIIEAIIVIFMAYLIVNYTIEKTNMTGDSMAPTLNKQESILIDKFTYNFKDVKRFDVVVFKQSGPSHNFYNIKRVVGLPGENIQIKDNDIYINGEKIEEKINTEAMENYGLAVEEIQLEENEYFVLGDNRNNSEDSRFANINNVLESEIVGRAIIRLSPFNFINKINLKNNKQ